MSSCIKTVWYTDLYEDFTRNNIRVFWHLSFFLILTFKLIFYSYIVKSHVLERKNIINQAGTYACSRNHIYENLVYLLFLVMKNYFFITCTSFLSKLSFAQICFFFNSMIYHCFQILYTNIGNTAPKLLAYP